MKMLNLGCGTKTSLRPGVINIDWSFYLRLKRNPVLRFLARRTLKGVRLDRFEHLAENVLVHDLRKGLPFEADSVDAVYHSHVLEHIDRDLVEGFLLEIKRVLRPGGIQRIVVPDFEKLCRDYLEHLRACEGDPTEAQRHEAYIGAAIEQCVRKAAFSTRELGPFRGRIETLLLGDARGRGETHQWMYDRVSLATLLVRLGYKDPQVHRYNTSSIPEWTDYGLDSHVDGREYKADSFYLEVRK